MRKVFNLTGLESVTSHLQMCSNQNLQSLQKALNAAPLKNALKFRRFLPGHGVKKRGTTFQ